MALYKNNSTLIKQKAIQLGFSACGIAKAGRLPKEENHLNDWLQKGYQAEMGYMANNREKRVDPCELIKGAKSVIVVLLNYYPEKFQKDDVPKVAKYAYGKDYHYVVKGKLEKLFEFIHKEIQPVNGRAFCDSAPVLEHAWAVKAGLGWIGKNTQLINKEIGSFAFIGELIIDLELEYDNPVPEHCGSCTKCIDNCPTAAIEAPYQINARKCISYLTIELRDEIPSQFKGKMKNYVFGCDICQNVCPWNKKVIPNKIEDLQPNPKFLSMVNDDWNSLSRDTYKELFKDTPVDRIGYKGLLRNIEFLK
ncbi:MAG: tRNA epoxyqueuosine(34) reductase QueG [Bacteroidales bacterium]|nr:tRNA epoxyqueuosine(34) reductase QueG [Bacteroidales bacterium]